MGVYIIFENGCSEVHEGLQSQHLRPFLRIQDVKTGVERGGEVRKRDLGQDLWQFGRPQVRIGAFETTYHSTVITAAFALCSLFLWFGSKCVTS
jgi:hypothetical protein